MTDTTTQERNSRKIRDDLLNSLIKSTDLNTSKLKEDVNFFKILILDGIIRYLNLPIHKNVSDNEILTILNEINNGNLKFYYILEKSIVPYYWLDSDFDADIGFKKNRENIRIMFIMDNKYISDVEKLYLKYFKGKYTDHYISMYLKPVKVKNTSKYNIKEYSIDDELSLYTVENMYIKLPKMEILKIFDKMFPNISPFKSCQLLEMINFYKTSCEDCKDRNECNDGCKYKIISIKQLLDFSKENFSLL